MADTAQFTIGTEASFGREVVKPASQSAAQHR